VLIFFHKKEREGTLPNSFYEASITLISNPDKDTCKKRELQANLSNEHKILNEILTN
jgi:hypothetical protein